MDYADYKVPTDSIQYYSYYIRLKEQRLRNTAGKERDGSLLCGYAGEAFLYLLPHLRHLCAKRILCQCARAGSTPLGYRLRPLPVRHRPAPSRRQPSEGDKPFGTGAVRWKATSLIRTIYAGNTRTGVARLYAHASRHAGAEVHQEHLYGKPPGMKALIAERHSLNAGLNVEHQHNRRSGWGFIIPDFETTSWGGYAFDRYFLSDDLILNAGIRINRVVTRIHSYHDWYKTPVAGSDSVYRERSERLRRSFNSFTWSLGVNYSAGAWIWKANIGKSFRVPIPKELGADGVNYHIFRYEKGEAGLSPEESYQFDAGIYWHNEALDIRLDSLRELFPQLHLPEPHFGLHRGLADVLLHAKPGDPLRGRGGHPLPLPSPSGSRGEREYLYAEQLSGNKKGYTLPFSPPEVRMWS